MGFNASKFSDPVACSSANMNTLWLMSFFVVFLLSDVANSQAKNPSKLPAGKHDHGDIDPSDPGLADFFERTRRSGFLMYKVHEFEFYPETSWKDLAKNASKSKETYLTDISDTDIEKIFNLNGTITKYTGPSLKYDVHSFEVRGKDLFSSSSEWYLENNGKSEKIKPDDDIVISNAKEVRLLEKTKDGKTGINILFELGPKFEMLKHTLFPEIRSGHLQKGKMYDMIMSAPRLEVITKDGEGKIKYKISMHAMNESMNFPLTKEQMEGDKAFQVVTNLTYYLLSHPDLVEQVSKQHLGLTYSYQDVIISMKDYGFQTLLSNWTSLSSDKSVKINVYGAMKSALTDPLAIFRFNKDGDLIHKHHEVDFGSLHTPAEFNLGTGFFPGFIYSGKNTDNPDLEEWIMKRVMNISETIHDKGIDENKLGDIQNWMQNMIREDFRFFKDAVKLIYMKSSDEKFCLASKKFRMGEDNVTFHVYDEHFAVQTLLKMNDETRILVQGADIPRMKDKKKGEAIH